MKVIWTAKAERQLDHIFNYIASDSKLYAYRVVRQIIDRAESLSEFREKSHQLPESKGSLSVYEAEVSNNVYRTFIGI